jgi:hypothetical protein
MARRDLFCSFLALLIGVLSFSTSAWGQSQQSSAGRRPVIVQEFHFSNPQRDAQYRHLRAEVERRMSVFGDASNAALRAVAVPGPRPGTPTWFQARTLVDRAIQARRPLRDALMTLIAFARRERRVLTGEEAEAADDVILNEERTLLGTSNTVIDLLGLLSGLRIEG